VPPAWARRVDFFRVAQVTKRYAKALALDHVTVTIEPGEFVAVIGRSGAGKTTLLRCLGGAVPVSASELEWRAAKHADIESRRLSRRGQARTGRRARRRQLGFESPRPSARARASQNSMPMLRSGPRARPRAARAWSRRPAARWRAARPR
jgi:ABC-type phosphonate transport system ATPase subunit